VTGFGKALKLFAAEKTAVLGVSVDDVESHRRWAAELGGVTYPLLADQGGEFAKACGVFDEREQVAMRATFLLDQKRTVIFAEACPINVGRSVDETFASCARIEVAACARQSGNRAMRSAPATESTDGSWRFPIQLRNGDSLNVSRAFARSYLECRMASSPRRECWRD
jgi:alkyl hydroperoxide reductase subunit AhpC